MQRPRSSTLEDAPEVGVGYWKIQLALSSVFARFRDRDWFVHGGNLHTAGFFSHACEAVRNGFGSPVVPAVKPVTQHNGRTRQCACVLHQEPFRPGEGAVSRAGARSKRFDRVEFL